jgi:hypothetical protein
MDNQDVISYETIYLIDAQFLAVARIFKSIFQWAGILCCTRNSFQSEESKPSSQLLRTATFLAERTIPLANLCKHPSQCYVNGQ